MYNDAEISCNLYTFSLRSNLKCKIGISSAWKKNSLSNQWINGKQDVTTYPCLIDSGMRHIGPSLLERI